MKFIFSFLLYMVFLSPVFATITEDCSPYSTNENICSGQPGCYWDDFDDTTPCQECPAGFGCINGNQIQCNNQLGAHQQHPEGASSCSDFICDSGWRKTADGTGCELNCTNIPDNAYIPAGEENCNNWACNENFYKKSDGTGCSQCPDGSISAPGADSISQCTCQSKSNSNNAMSLLLIQITGNQYYCGWCGDGTASNTNPVQCTCYHGANIVNGEQTVANNIPVQCKCPSNTDTADTTTNTCLCGADHYLKNNNGTWTCEQCPAHSHHSIIGSEDVNDCGCDATYPASIYDENNKLIGCGQCPDSNSTYDRVANKCKCIKGYYNTSTSTEPNMVSCTACPLGMTTDNIGSNSANDCHMTSNTKFCYRDSNNNEHCMNLIPTGASSINGQNAN